MPFSLLLLLKTNCEYALNSVKTVSFKVFAMR